MKRGPLWERFFSSKVSNKNYHVVVKIENELRICTEWYGERGPWRVTTDDQYRNGRSIFSKKGTSVGRKIREGLRCLSDEEEEYQYDLRQATKMYNQYSEERRTTADVSNVIKTWDLLDERRCEVVRHMQEKLGQDYQFNPTTFSYCNEYAIGYLQDLMFSTSLEDREIASCRTFKGLRYIIELLGYEAILLDYNAVNAANSGRYTIPLPEMDEHKRMVIIDMSVKKIFAIRFGKKDILVSDVQGYVEQVGKEAILAGVHAVELRMCKASRLMLGAEFTKVSVFDVIHGVLDASDLAVMRVRVYDYNVSVDGKYVKDDVGQKWSVNQEGVYTNVIIRKDKYREQGTRYDSLCNDRAVGEMIKGNDKILSLVKTISIVAGEVRDMGTGPSDNHRARLIAMGRFIAQILKLPDENNFKRDILEIARQRQKPLMYLQAAFYSVLGRKSDDKVPEALESLGRFDDAGYKALMNCFERKEVAMPEALELIEGSLHSSDGGLSPFRFYIAREFWTRREIYGVALNSEHANIIRNVRDQLPRILRQETEEDDHLGSPIVGLTRSSRNGPGRYYDIYVNSNYVYAKICGKKVKLYSKEDRVFASPRGISWMLRWLRKEASDVQILGNSVGNGGGQQDEDVGGALFNGMLWGEFGADVAKWALSKILVGDIKVNSSSSNCLIRALVGADNTSGYMVNSFISAEAVADCPVVTLSTGNVEHDALVYDNYSGFIIEENISYIHVIEKVSWRDRNVSVVSVRDWESQLPLLGIA